MNIFESRVTSAPCNKCARLKSIKSKGGQFTGWACTKQGALNDQEHPLNKLPPDMLVEKMFGMVIATTVIGADGRRFACRFMPRRSENRKEC